MAVEQRAQGPRRGALGSAEVWWIDLAASAIIFKVFGGGLNQGKVVVDDVGDTDGGCAGVVGGGVAASGGDDDGCGGSLWGAVCMTALAVELSVVCAVADCCCRPSFACVAISWVLVLVWD